MGTISYSLRLRKTFVTLNPETKTDRCDIYKNRHLSHGKQNTIEAMVNDKNGRTYLQLIAQIRAHLCKVQRTLYRPNEITCRIGQPKDVVQSLSCV